MQKIVYKCDLCNEETAEEIKFHLVLNGEPTGLRGEVHRIIYYRDICPDCYRVTRGELNHIQVIDDSGMTKSFKARIKEMLCQ